jgi:hypothetical protein
MDGSEFPLQVRLFRLARTLGAVLLVVTVALLVVLPGPGHAGATPPGMRTPILVFELARTRAEVEALFGPPGSLFRAELVRRMDLGNAIDFLFMPLYGGLLAVVALALGALHGRRYRLAAALSVFAVTCDALENAQLFAITRALGGDYDAALARLRVFTWLKWGTLAFCMAWLGPALLRGTRLERVVGALGILVGTLAIGAYLDRALFAEAFALSVSLAFLGLWIVALRRV